MRANENSSSYEMTKISDLTVTGLFGVAATTLCAVGKISVAEAIAATAIVAGAETVVRNVVNCRRFTEVAGYGAAVVALGAVGGAAAYHVQAHPLLPEVRQVSLQNCEPSAPAAFTATGKDGKLYAFTCK